MKNPDLIHSLTHCTDTIETALLSTIHLINDTIFTDYEELGEGTAEEPVGI
jgi:hypothetical protein